MISTGSGARYAGAHYLRRLIAAGFAALRVPSYARAAPTGGENLVVWRWGPGLPHRLVLNDADGRLNP